MSPRQRELLTFFKRYVAQNGLAPSYKEMAHALGLKTASSISPHINALLLDGHLTHKRGYRGLALPPAKCCPNCGCNLEAQ